MTWTKYIAISKRTSSGVAGFGLKVNTGGWPKAAHLFFLATGRLINIINGNNMAKSVGAVLL